jgi:hypothetical protein
VWTIRLKGGGGRSTTRPGRRNERGLREGRATLSLYIGRCIPTAACLSSRAVVRSLAPIPLPPALDHLPPLLEMPANIHSLNDHKGKRPAAAATTASERASKKTRRRGSASSSDDDEDVDDGAAHGGAGGGDGSDDSSDEGMHVDDLDRIAALVGRGRAPGKRAVKPLPGAAAAAAAASSLGGGGSGGGSAGAGPSKQKGGKVRRRRLLLPLDKT